MAVQWTDHDLGMKKIERELRRLAKVAVTVGVHGTGEIGKDDKDRTVRVDEHTGPGKNDEPIVMAQLAAIHEFGTDTIPERSFIRAGVDDAGRKLQQAYDTGYQRILDGKATAPDAGNLLGVIAVGAIKLKILEGLQPELAPATKKRRDKSKVTGKRLRSNNAVYTGYQPLLDSGQLEGSIAYQVEKSKGGK